MNTIKALIIAVLLSSLTLVSPKQATANHSIIDPNACVPKLISPANKAIVGPGSSLVWSSCPDGTGSYEVWTHSVINGGRSMIRISGTTWGFGQTTMFPGMYKWTIYNCMTMNCYTKSKPAQSQIFYWNPFLD